MGSSAPSLESPRPAASVITVNFNEKHRMVSYLPSVWAAKGDFEVIISDNASVDGSVEYIERHFPKTRIIRNQANLGFAGGNNQGAKHARGELLVFLNADTTVEPDWLTELLQPFADPSVGCATAKLLLMSAPSKINTCGNDVHISGITMCRGVNQPRERFPEREEVAAVSGAAFAIRRELFEQAGGFNEHFFTYMEETALSLEAWLRGRRCVYVPGSVVYHDYALRFGPRKTYFQERNRYMALLQLYRWPTLLVLLPTLLLAEVVAWGFVALLDRRNWKNKLQAYRDVVRNWPAVAAKRRRNLAQRTVADRTLLKLTDYRLDFGQVSHGAVARLAAAVFNPGFWLLRRLTLAVVRW